MHALTRSNIPRIQAEGVFCHLMDGPRFTDKHPNLAALGRANLEATVLSCVEGRTLKKGEFLDAQHIRNPILNGLFRAAKAVITGNSYRVAHHILKHQHQLDFADLSRLNFDRITFLKSTFKAVRFQGASFRNTQFTGANFKHCQMNKSDFTEAVLHLTDLSHSSLKHALFDRAELRHSIANHTDFSNVGFKQALLLNSEFSDAAFRKANLSDAVMVGNVFNYANFSDATLERVNVHLWYGLIPQNALAGNHFRYTIFRNTNVTMAQLLFSRFQKAIFRTATRDGRAVEGFTGTMADFRYSKHDASLPKSILDAHIFE
jgi:uncharacterized protein YjbI with pentapeptide repeats